MLFSTVAEIYIPTNRAGWFPSLLGCRFLSRTPRATWTSALSWLTEVAFLVSAPSGPLALFSLLSLPVALCRLHLLPNSCLCLRSQPSKVKLEVDAHCMSSQLLLQQMTVNIAALNNAR